MSDDFFDQLNAEIAQALEKSQLPKKVAEAKRKAFDRTVGQAVRDKHIREWQELQAMLDMETWRPTSVIALFTEQLCDGCGSVHRVFLQYMEHQVQKSRPSNARWKRVPSPLPNLPRETLIQPHHTHICADCCEDHGFSFGSASRLEISTSALAVSSSYLQEDINAQAEIN